MQTETIQLVGLNSEMSIQKIDSALLRITGVASVRVSLLESLVEVEFSKALTKLSQLEEALTGAGFRIAQLQSEKGGCCGGCCG